MGRWGNVGHRAILRWVLLVYFWGLPKMRVWGRALSDIA